MRQFLIIGAGGHAREVLWLARRCLDRSVRLRIAVESQWDAPSELDGIKVEPIEAILPNVNGIDYVVAIGKSSARERIAETLDSAGGAGAVLIDPSVQLSDRVTLGSGSIIFANSVLTCDITVGRHVHINSGCLVHHDVKLGDFATLSPGVRIAGNVKVEQHSFLGIGATITNGTGTSPLVIGKRAIVAAGACVIGSVEADSMVAGVPAVRKR